MRAGERIKKDSRDAERLARLLRAGELTPIWAPDEIHEAMRDLVRARDSAAEDQRHRRQLIATFLLRHSRIYYRPKNWTMRYRRWLERHSCATDRFARDGFGRTPCRGTGRAANNWH